MKIATKEFFEMRVEFEKAVNKIPGVYGCEVKRDTSGIKGIFYTNGEINKLFHAYMMGYAFKEYLDR